MNTVKKILITIVEILAIFMMIFTIVSVATFNRNDRTVFGYKAFIVLSDSMKATDFASGDLVLIKSTDPTTLQEGDIIAFTSQNPDNYGEVVTHKIRMKTVDAEGNPGFVTYGTTTDTDDEVIVTYPYILGKYQFHIPKLGKFFMFLKTVPGYLCCILVPFLILIGAQGINTIKLFRQYKREQMAEIEEQRAQIEEEKRQSAEMMQEIIRLKEQLANSRETAQVSAARPYETQPSVEKEAEKKETAADEEKN